MRINKFDTREYRPIILPNNLCAILVYDESATTSAASLTVGVGSYMDGDVEGIAHFLEHLLFMGSEKYPVENHYTEFLSKHGGESNAYTSDDHTCYYFSVNSEYLEEGLKIFSRFFIDPCLSEKCVDKEMNAVNSEHIKNITSDYWRTLQLLKYEVNSDHPFSKFTTGNLQTLNKPDILDKVRNFWKNYYSANIMKLSVISNLNLDDQESLIRSIFSEILNKQINLDKLICDKPLFANHEKIIEMIPIEKTKNIYLYWEISSQFIKNYKSNPINYISYILGNESQGSILDNLKINKYATNLLTGTLVCNSLFCIEIELTELGLLNIEKVINTVYQYIELIKIDGINEALYNDFLKVNYLRWIHSTKSDAQTCVNNISSLMFNYSELNLCNILTLPEYFKEYNENINKLIYEFISSLFPSKCNY